MTDVSYAVPVATTSSFLVITERPPEAAAAGLTTITWPARDSPFDPADVLDGWDGPSPAASAFHTLIACTTEVRRLPRLAQVARAGARSVAVSERGLLIDWLTREVVLSPERPERAQFRLGDQWLGFDFHVYEERHRDIPPSDPWRSAPRPEDACGALRLQTRGVARFGLPELVVDGVDCRNELTARNVLRAVGQHLLTDHWTWLSLQSPAPVSNRQISSQHRIGGLALAEYWGSSLPGEIPLTVTLTAGDAALRVGAPDGMLLNDWLDSHRGFLRSLVGSPPDDFDTYARLQL
jgi:hypothetical protein